MINHVKKERLNEFIRNREFSNLFVELGWDKENLDTTPLQLSLDEGRDFRIEPVAEKRGFAVCVCNAGEDYPEQRSERRKLVNLLSRHHYEHLLIIHGKGRQCWMVAIRPQNRPMRTVEVEWREDQDIQPLMEKLDGMIFDISEEDRLGITDVVARVRGAFMQGAEQVTKKFYRDFKDELKAFSGFIDGIQETVSRKWYAALMLNRLMFIYFIQKKRFLDGDINYLENRLNKTKKEYGADKFHNHFYRHFLRRLFSEGLGMPESERDPELKNLLGKIPYLNGGLFDLHQVERDNENIQIPDAAFEQLFTFFGQYSWHLDSGPLAPGKDINPDVIGYIFEKYINDRAEMGAYYTQEDITGYIARNTIIPFLLHRAEEKCKNSFDPENGIWRFLRRDPDNYIYDAVKKGCDIDDSEIPDNIRRGVDTKAPELIERRKDWNTKTEERFALPTEIWRETMARRKRYFELKAKIENGEIHRIDDLITHNLDIERFASDALRLYDGSDFIDAFYEAIAGRKSLRSNSQEKRGVTVLDPACGSGAFLFAALNILEPLYERCVERMQDFVDQDDREKKRTAQTGEKKHPQFRVVLKDIEKHQNQKYWIYKTIILNNLYGVDMMKEATEIAKLRLFLKLAAEAEYDVGKSNLGLEPLPDIDFNIRSGNSLVGFANMAAFEKELVIDDQSRKLIRDVQEQAKLIQTTNNAFKRAQDVGGEDYRKAKIKLNERLASLNDKMNQYLAKQYGKDGKGKDFEQWLATHQPFHWLAEFYGIIEENGGFDVVIGNPPYVEYKKVKKVYTVRDYETESCGNTYAMFIERSDKIIKKESRFGMIVPSSASTTDGYIPIQKILFNACSAHISSYSDQRGKLFEIPHPRLCILIYRKNAQKGESQIYTTTYNKLGFRKNLFSLLAYNDAKECSILGRIPRIGCDIEKQILKKVSSKDKVEKYMSKRGFCAYYTRKISWYLQATDFIPEIYNGENVLREPSELKKIYFETEHLASKYFSLLNSTLFYWFITIGSDCRNLNKRETCGFTIKLDSPNLNELQKIANELSEDLIRHSELTTMSFKDLPFPNNKLKIQCIYPQYSKSIIDKIDNVLAKHYRFNEEELDFIVNYDIKYRMGQNK